MPLTRREFTGFLVDGLGALQLKGVLPALGLTGGGRGMRSLGEGFSNPPHSAKPWVYWMWVNGNITREGITADLGAMKTAGIGGALIINLGYDEPGPVHFMTGEWQGMFRHAVAEARRLGLVIDMNEDDGWDCGGPSITPENAMQKVVWTETHVRGPREASSFLPQPPATWNYYRNICVIAFPRPAGEETHSTEMAPKITTSSANPPYLQLAFVEPLTARAVVVSATGRWWDRPATCELQMSMDGRNFRRQCQFETGWEYPTSVYSSITVGFEEARARFYRLLMPGISAQGLASRTLNLRLLGGARISFWEFKGGFTSIREYGAGVPFFLTRNEEARAGLRERAIIRHEDVIDLTEKMGAGGELRWLLPPGNWTILRIGYTPTGQDNHAATAQGKGPDCNKLSATGVQTQFRAVLGKLLVDVASAGARTFSYAHDDSWESGCQNWTSDFREEFQKRRGYDLLPYLPALAGGRVVDSVEVSERFLWDVRRTLADLIAENYWEVLWNDCHAHGLKFSEEAGGRQQFMYDPINYLSKGDIPMGEFWMGEAQPRPDCKLAASAAHIRGNTLVGGEAFTCGATKAWPYAGKWRSHPFLLKPLGDKAFCTGVNHFTLHRYLLQPWTNRLPGLTWAIKGFTIGTSFERTNTWWKPGAAWIEYLSRSQFLLQQGRFVADVCVFTGESVPNTLFRPYKDKGLSSEAEDASLSTQRALDRSHLAPILPPLGYDFDGCDFEALSQMSVKAGRLVLPHGMSYRLLTLPPLAEMMPRTLGVIKALVEAGATVVGPKPARSPSLSGYPACNDEVRRLANQVWGACDGQRVKEHSFGRGKVVWGKPIKEVLFSLGLRPDFEYVGAGAELDYIHRTAGDAEIYFVSNQRDRSEEVECAFRVAGAAPELWHSDTGRIFRCAVFDARDGRTVVPLRFDPFGSVFVVFRRSATRKSVIKITRNGKEFPKFANGLSETFQGIEVQATGNNTLVVTAAVPGEYQFKTSGGQTIRADLPRLYETFRIEGPWEVHFPPNSGAQERAIFPKLIPWNEHQRDGVKYFSGTAMYVNDFELPPQMAGRGRAIYLDLGKVKEIASAKLNGKELGVLWKPPFLVEISDVVRPGKNRLELKVTNLWPNRLIGDLRVPKDKHVGWTNWNPYTKTSPLLESGLIGPVRIWVAARVQCRW